MSLISISKSYLRKSVSILVKMFLLSAYLVVNGSTGLVHRVLCFKSEYCAVKDYKPSIEISHTCLWSMYENLYVRSS